MSYTFRLSSDIKEPLHALIAIAGGSSTGKTHSAMRIATGLAGGKTFAYIDTEAGRALHKRTAFYFAHCDFTPYDDKDQLQGYPPERYIEVIDEAEKAGFPVIVIDSFSHVWEGMGGVLEMHAEALDRMTRSDDAKRSKVSILAWGKVKPRYRRLLHRIIQCRAHVILCIRAKERIAQPGGGFMGKSKIRREDLPYDAVCDGNLVYEMTASFMLTPERIGVPITLKIPDELVRAFPADAQLDEHTGEIVKKWSESGGASGKKDKGVLDRARNEARKGFEAVNAFWKTLDAGERDLIRPIMGELKRIATEADRVDDDIPFGNDEAPVDPDEEEARIKREAEKAMKGDDKS